MKTLFTNTRNGLLALCLAATVLPTELHAQANRDTATADTATTSGQTAPARDDDNDTDLGWIGLLGLLGLAGLMRKNRDHRDHVTTTTGTGT
ncbi:MAG TPA: WGxxGxxG family protein, partial [Chthoniobacteraceae bacterium]